jgi:probable HAF family extracellular repeat protein
MDRRNRMLLGLLLAALPGACRDESPNTTGPSTEPALAAVTAAATYSIKNLGTLGGTQSAAHAINNVGETVGWSNTSSGQRHAFLHRAGVMRDLGALAGGVSQAVAINDSGVVVGWSWILSGASRAVRWQGGVKKNLGTLGGRNSAATGINEDGVIVGWSETTRGDKHAFLWKNGVMTDIGTLGGRFSQANGINKAGRVVGWSATASGETHAFAWKDGKFQDLGDHGRDGSTATAINSGRIVGTVGPLEGAVGGEADQSNPFVFFNGVFTVFGTRQITSEANGVNPDGIIVGDDYNERDETATVNAWVRQTDGTVQYLPELSDGSAAAHGINRYGTIVGYSALASGQIRAVIWRPQ